MKFAALAFSVFLLTGCAGHRISAYHHTVAGFGFIVIDSSLVGTNQIRVKIVGICIGNTAGGKLPP